jgi:type VI secretion system protein ImpH
MAAQSGIQSPDITESAVEARLHEEPFRFGFFQAVRLLKQLSKGGDQKENGSLSDIVAFRPRASTGFPASQIQSIQQGGREPPLITVNFMGLTGPMGVLPLPYSETAIESASTGNSAMRDFFDIFSNRLIALFYQAWERNHPFVQHESGGVDALTVILLDLIGLGTPALRRLEGVPHEIFACHASLLLPRPRSAASLREVLTAYFDVPVEIQQFVGAWYPIEPDCQFRLEEGGTTRDRLGGGAVLGDEVWSREMKVRVRLGPLTMGQYLQFLPGGSAHKSLMQIVRHISNAEWECELQLVLKREEVPGCELGASAETSPRLGWLTWIRSSPLRRDPEDTVLYLG